MTKNATQWRSARLVFQSIKSIQKDSLDQNRLKGVFVHYCAILHQYCAVYVEEFRALYCQLDNHDSRCNHDGPGLYLHDAWCCLRQGEKAYASLVSLVCI